MRRHICIRNSYIPIPVGRSGEPSVSLKEFLRTEASLKPVTHKVIRITSRNKSFLRLRHRASGCLNISYSKISRTTKNRTKYRIYFLTWIHFYYLNVIEDICKQEYDRDSTHTYSILTIVEDYRNNYLLERLRTNYQDIYIHIWKNSLLVYLN